MLLTRKARDEDGVRSYAHAQGLQTDAMDALRDDSLAACLTAQTLNPTYFLGRLQLSNSTPRRSSATCGAEICLQKLWA